MTVVAIKKILFCISAADKNLEDMVYLVDARLQAETDHNSKFGWPKNNKNKLNHRSDQFVDLSRSICRSSLFIT